MLHINCDIIWKKNPLFINKLKSSNFILAYMIISLAMKYLKNFHLVSDGTFGERGGGDSE